MPTIFFFLSPTDSHESHHLLAVEVTWCEISFLSFIFCVVKNLYNFSLKRARAVFLFLVSKLVDQV